MARPGVPLTTAHKAAIRAGRLRGAASHEDNFWAKVDKNGPLFDGEPCWLFTAKSERKGYGVMWWHGKVCYVHRISWILAGHELTPGMNIDHRCKRIKCVNPAHLRLVTPRVSALENCTSPLARNAALKECPYGHPYTGYNVHRVKPARQKNRHGNLIKNPMVQRQCNVCYLLKLKNPEQAKRFHPSLREFLPKGK